MNTHISSVDVLAIGAHPDDLELCCGGTLLRLKALGYSVGMVDMTRGERGTRGTAETRAKEAKAAFRILDFSFRENLDLGDQTLADTPEKRQVVVECIRRHRPTLVITHWPFDRHPDHDGCGTLVKQAMFLAGAAGYEAEGAPHAPRKLMHFPAHWLVECNVYVDVSDFYAKKVEAAQCYGSQFYQENSTEPATFISRKEFWEDLEARHRFLGSQIGVKYAEGFIVREKIRVDDPVAMLCQPGMAAG